MAAPWAFAFAVLLGGPPHASVPGLGEPVRPAPSLSRPCVREAPPVNKVGFRPGATVPYAVGPSRDGVPFPTRLLACVTRAFDAWTAANARGGAWVRFVPGGHGLVVRFDTRTGFTLPPGRAGGWSDPERDVDGYLERAKVWLTADTRRLRTCDGVTKVLLHELGHLHGLDDLDARVGRSVMHPLGGADDRAGRLPLAPTACDAAAAALASLAPPARLFRILALWPPT